jgi:hypothetical protein
MELAFLLFPMDLLMRVKLKKIELMVRENIQTLKEIFMKESLNGDHLTLR